MSELLLDSLKVKGYRCFEDLTIEKLGRINLIVGKNNSGKTALLEALWIYARRGTFRILFDLLFSRDEVPIYIERKSPVQVTDIKFQKEDLLAEAGNLFYGRQTLDADSKKLIFVGSDNSSLSVDTTRLIDKDGQPSNDFSIFERLWGVHPTGLIVVSALKEKGEEKRSEFYSFENLQSLMFEPPPDPLPSSFIKSQILNNEALVRLWDDAVRKSLEDKAIHFLKIIEPRIEYINFVGTAEGSDERHPITNNGHSSKRVALKSYGEGMTRLLGISLALVQSRDGILLIDEIENGLHYSALRDVWRLIFNTARDLNIQVFATTHSYDCVEAFTQAASEDKDSDGILLRLENKEKKINAVTFNESELETVARRNIEVR